MPANPARISQITQAARAATQSDASVKVLSLGARDVEVVSALYDYGAATTEVTRQFDLMKVARNIYQITLIQQNGQCQVGQSITVKYPRFGLADGKVFMITGVSEQWGRGLTILTLWG
ncbi:MAG: hypothetical protein JKY45_02570 [Emcibacter sp.]|nr:hypothetical protein [Emcibacter sp.]